MGKYKNGKSETVSGKKPAIVSEAIPTAAKSSAKPSRKEAHQAVGLPMFYSRIEMLNFNRHAELRYKAENDYRFVAGANYIPLTAMEFGDAASHHPIVFAGSGDNLEPMVITGRNQGENQQIDKDGNWKTGNYIPAYVRRFPFIIVSDEANQTLSLAADVSSTKFGGTGAAIYEDGKPSEIAQRAMQFCISYQQAALATATICKAIAATGLLVERSAEFVLPAGKYRVNGFKIVDEAALIALPDNSFIELRKAGALPVIYMHLQSMKAWRNLLD